MGSIYEYKLQFIPGVGSRVPEFIMVHEIVPYVVYTDTYLGYAESGHISQGTVEYADKEAFAARIRQIHKRQPFGNNIGTVDEPVFEEFTAQELEEYIDATWYKNQTVKAVVNEGEALEYYFNSFEIQYWFANLGLQPDDNREIVDVTPAAVPAQYDIYWPAAPVQEGDSWVQQWGGRSYTDYEIDEAREKKKLKINEERYAALNNGFYSETFEKNIDSDERSRSNIATTAQKCILSIAKNESPFNITWRVADDTYVTVTREQFLAMNDELSAFIQDVYQTSWDRKAAVDAATTRVGIDGA